MFTELLMKEWYRLKLFKASKWMQTVLAAFVSNRASFFQWKNPCACTCARSGVQTPPVAAEPDSQSIPIVTFIDPDETYGTFLVNEDGSVTYCVNDPNPQEFDFGGVLTAVVDTEDFPNSFSYDGEGGLTAVDGLSVT
jgi:hypothetical protein